jgi:hypothetical protein
MASKEHYIPWRYCRMLKKLFPCIPSYMSCISSNFLASHSLGPFGTLPSFFCPHLKLSPMIQGLWFCGAVRDKGFQILGHSHHRQQALRLIQRHLLRLTTIVSFLAVTSSEIHLPRHRGLSRLTHLSPPRSSRPAHLSLRLLLLATQYR